MDDGIAENVVQENFIDAPASKSDIRLRSPDRKKAAKRGSDRHDGEPRPKQFIFENIDMEEDDGIDVDSLAARKEDQLILHHGMLGHDLTETYSSRRLKWRRQDLWLGN